MRKAQQPVPAKTQLPVRSRNPIALQPKPRRLTSSILMPPARKSSQRFPESAMRTAINDLLAVRIADSGKRCELFLAGGINIDEVSLLGFGCSAIGFRLLTGSCVFAGTGCCALRIAHIG